MKSFSSHTCILINLLFVCLYVFVSPVAAQDLDNVTIHGTVLDQNQAAVPGAQVSVTRVATGGLRSAITDIEGRYHLIQLPPGTCSIRVTRNGFAPVEQPALTGSAGQTLQLDFTLLPEEIVADPVVVVVNESSKVDTTRTVVGATIDRNELDSIPLASRSPLDLVFTLPGVTEEPLSTRDLAEDRPSGHARDGKGEIHDGG